MNKEERFTIGVEKLVNPIDVGTMHAIQSFNELLPRTLQDKLMRSSVKQFPYMGFVVEPYSYFLCHEITDLEQAKLLLPDGFRLIKTSIFKDDEPKYYVIFGCVRAHTSAFWGSRMEFYIVAEDEATGLLTWVIIDYDSDTVSHDPKRGLRSASVKNAVISTSHRGKLYVDFRNEVTGRELVFSSDLETGRMSELGQRLWLEGNLSICYGRELSAGKALPFSLKFDPLEVEKALNIPRSAFKLDVNTWFPGLFDPVPSQLVCFPYAQHFVSDSPGHVSAIKTEAELVTATDNLDFTRINVFSTKSFKIMMRLAAVVSALVSLSLLILLIIK